MITIYGYNINLVFGSNYIPAFTAPGFAILVFWLYTTLIRSISLV